MEQPQQGYPQGYPQQGYPLPIAQPIIQQPQQKAPGNSNEKKIVVTGLLSILIIIWLIRKIIKYFMKNSDTTQTDQGDPEEDCPGNDGNGVCFEGEWLQNDDEGYYDDNGDYHYNEEEEEEDPTEATEAQISTIAARIAASRKITNDRLAAAEAEELARNTAEATVRVLAAEEAAKAYASRSELVKMLDLQAISQTVSYQFSTSAINTWWSDVKTLKNTANNRKLKTINITFEDTTGMSNNIDVAIIISSMTIDGVAKRFDEIYNISSGEIKLLDMDSSNIVNRSVEGSMIILNSRVIKRHPDLAKVTGKITVTFTYN